MIRYFLSIFSFLGFISFTPVFANHPLTLLDFFKAVPDAAVVKSSPYSSSLTGTVFTAPNGQTYEIRAFSFEDTSEKLPPNTTFQQYVTRNNLLERPSTSTTSKTLEFQTFRSQSMNVNDGVYFMLALKYHPNQSKKDES